MVEVAYYVDMMSGHRVVSFPHGLHMEYFIIHTCGETEFLYDTYTNIAHRQPTRSPLYPAIGVGVKTMISELHSYCRPSIRVFIQQGSSGSLYVLYNICLSGHFLPRIICPSLLNILQHMDLQSDN